MAIILKVKSNTTFEPYRRLCTVFVLAVCGYGAHTGDKPTLVFFVQANKAEEGEGTIG